ncbi:MAG: AI-2E family transporter [Chthoniobacterales bacterium]
MTHPTRFQRRSWFAALTGLSIATIVALIATVGYFGLWVIAFLRPVLMPLAVAAILAYLLDPVVGWLMRRGVARFWAVVLVFCFFTLGLTLLSLWVIPAIIHQGAEFAKRVPFYTWQAQVLVTDAIEWTRTLPDVLQGAGAEDGVDDPASIYLADGVRQGILWLQEQVPILATTVGDFLIRGIGGAFGVFGFLLSLILVPIFLFFFLKEKERIVSSWSQYLPLRASPFKSEVVSLLNEINTYLINFFRGQLLVSLIDGALIGVILLTMGMQFAVVIGLMVGVLGLIPYAGVLICWIPAVLIAAAQWQDWQHPLAVTVIFLVVNNFDGMLIAPKIVGNSVGLHPLTVIVSVLAWSIVLGGLLGALLAVPLTATLKVVLKRYFWERAALRTVGGSEPSADTS